MIKYLSRLIFAAMTGALLPIAFVVVCFSYAYVGIVEWSDHVWLRD